MAKALLLVTPTELEIFQQHLAARARSRLAQFYRDYCSTKALLLVTATVLEIFYQEP